MSFQIKLKLRESKQTTKKKFMSYPFVTDNKLLKLVGNLKHKQQNDSRNITFYEFHVFSF